MNDKAIGKYSLLIESLMTSLNEFKYNAKKRCYECETCQFFNY